MRTLNQGRRKTLLRVNNANLSHPIVNLIKKKEIAITIYFYHYYLKQDTHT